MSNSAANLYDLINVAQGQIDNIAAVEYPAAGLTLTRSSTLAITTAGTQITWQSEIRGYAITWTGTTITIPTEGYYAIAVTIATVANTAITIRLVTNTVNNQGAYTAVPFNTGGGFMSKAYFGVYLRTNDSFIISVNPAANTTINVNNEFGAAPSPILHVVQLTGSVE